MTEYLRVNRDVSVPLDEVLLRASRSSGPGGQHANVTASRMEAVFEVEASASLTDEQKRRIVARCGPRIVAVAQDARGQARNRALALERLAARLATGLAVPRPRTATRPSRAAKAKRLDSKRRQGERKQARRRPGDEG
jgi:ribosome-associated protein